MMMSTVFAGGNSTKERKLLQVDIYPLDPPRDNQADEIDQLALELGTAAVFGREQTLGKDAQRSVRLERYTNERQQLPAVMRLIGKELSEPYSIYTYRYFLHYWPELCILAIDCATEAIIGAILCKIDQRVIDEETGFECGQGYIAMLAVEESWRGLGLGTRLVRTVIELMRQQGCDEVVLETEVNNPRSLSLYGQLGFIREALLFRYYLNGGDAYRLKLYLERQRPPARADADENAGITADDAQQDTRSEQLQQQADILHQMRMMRMEEEQQNGGHVDGDQCCCSSTHNHHH